MTKVDMETLDKTRRTDLKDIAGRTVIEVHSTTEPNAAGVLGIGRSAAYNAAKRGDLPTLRLGRRIVVPVPALLRMLGAEQ